MYWLIIASLLITIILFSFTSILMSYTLAEPIKAAIITFDDGMLSQHTYANQI
jgi:hypothetical protein